MSTAKLFALKGDTAWRPVGSTGAFKPFMNATAGQIALTATMQDQKSNGNVPGTIAEDEVDRTAKIEFTFQSRHKENLKHFLYANSVDIPAGTGVVFSLPAGVAGDIVDLGHSAITNAVFGTLVEGVDYRLNARAGSLEYIAATVALTAGTFDHAKYVKLGIFSADAVEIEILFTSEKSGHTYHLYRVKLSPAATYQLVQDGAGYGSAPLSGTLLIKPDAPVDGNLGQYGRLRSVD